MSDEVRMEIGKRTGVVPRDLVRLEGSIAVQLPLSELKKARTIFSIEADGYGISSGMFDDAIMLKRNNYSLVLPIGRKFSRHDTISIAFEWTPVRLKASYAIRGSSTEMFEKRTELRTQYTFAPASLISWLRKKGHVETVLYETEEGFRNRVCDILGSLQDSMSHLHSSNVFWNTISGSDRTLSRLPKKEIDIYSVIYSILSDQMLTSSIDVIPEYGAGAEKLGFMLRARIRDAGVSDIRLEIKNAHSPDLIDGLAIQLPASMESMGVEYGIYLVFWYGIYFDPSQDIDASNLEVELSRQQMYYHDPAFARRMKFFCIDLEAAKRGFEI